MTKYKNAYTEVYEILCCLNDEEYLKMLDAKLDEELAEYHKDQNIEELADIMEVIYAAAVARGYSVDELEKVREKKAEERGGFGYSS